VRKVSRRRGGLQERRQEAIPKAANNIGLVKQATGGLGVPKRDYNIGLVTQGEQVRWYSGYLLP
jgi:hypothetical protein